MTCRSVDLPPLWRYGPLRSTLRSEDVLKLPATSVASLARSPPARSGLAVAGFRTSPANAEVSGAAGGDTGLPFASTQPRPPPGTLILDGFARVVWECRVRE